jgi:subtilisin family serine protease
MNIKKSLILLTLLCSVFSYALFAQSADYAKGKLYVKVKNDADMILPEIRQEKDLVLFEAMGLNQFGDLMESYEVYHLERPFRGLNNEDLEHTYLLKFRQEGFELELSDRILGYNFIDYVEVEPLYFTTLTPNDPNLNLQWYLTTINAQDAWDVTTGSEDVVIAIVDAGFLPSHPDLAANIWTNPREIPGNGIDDDNNGYTDDANGWDAGDSDPDPSGVVGLGQYFEHGTSVAGCASPVTNNNVGIAGLGFNCKIMPVKGKTDAIAANTMLTQQQRRSLDATFPGITYAVRNRPAVINMSFGGPSSNATVQNLITSGYNAGIVFVGGGGNDNSSASFYPAAYDHVINVGSTNSSDRKSGFSNYGSTIDIMAPGSSIRSLSHNNALNPGYGTSDGTSLSAPIVAGLVGLMRSVNPCLTPDDVEFHMKNTAVNINAQNPNYIGQIGAGRIDAEAAVLAVAPNAAPAATFHYDTTSVCDGTIEFFYDGITMACPQNIFWSFNGNSSSELNPVFTIPDTGTYTVTLVVNNSVGTNQTTQTITVDNVLKVDAGGDANGVVTACVGDVVTLNGSTSNPTATTRWNPTSGMNNANLLNPMVGAITNRIYNLTVTDSTGCQVTDAVELVIVNSVDAGADETINLGDTVQLSAGVVGSGYTYEWTPTTGLSNPNIKNPKAGPDRNTTYTVKATAYSGCELTDDVTVSVNGGVGIFDGFDAVGEVYPAFPNPAATQMNLSASLNQPTHLNVKVYDLTGREIATLYDRQASGDVKIVWNREGAMSNGIYMLVWQTAEARYVQKVEWR